MVPQKKTIAIFGATGNQGFSVLNTVHSHPKLSALYTPVALTRSIESSAARALTTKFPGLELRTADADQPETLRTALAGVDSVFALTTTVYDGHARAHELRQGKNIADACIAAGVTHLVFSTLPSIGMLSGGKYTRMESFDAKAEVESYIRSLASKGLKSSFFAPGSFMQNFATVMRPNLSPAGDGSFVLTGIVDGKCELPCIDITQTGLWVGALLLEPEAYAGRVLAGSSGVYTWDEIADAMGIATGKTVKYFRVPETGFRAYLPEMAADALVDMLKFQGECGYYGDGTRERVDGDKRVAETVGTVVGLEQWLKENLSL